MQHYPTAALRRHVGEERIRCNLIQNLYSGAPGEAVTVNGGRTGAQPAQDLDTTSKQSLRMVDRRNGQAGSHVGLPNT